MERPIRNAAKALIMKDGKMLAIKISDGSEEWYIMPGGGQNSEGIRLHMGHYRRVGKRKVPARV